MRNLIDAVVFLALVVVGMLAVTAFRDKAQATARVAALVAQNDSLRDVQNARDTVYLARVDTFVRWRVRYDTARVTLNIHDTTEVLRFVYLADSTISSCTAALSACDQAKAVRDARILTLEDLVATQPTPTPRWLVWTERAAIAYLSFKLGQSAGR